MGHEFETFEYLDTFHKAKQKYMKTHTNDQYWFIKLKLAFIPLSIFGCQEE